MALRIVLALLLLTACGGAAQETTPRPAGEAPSATMVPRGPEPSATAAPRAQDASATVKRAADIMRTIQTVRGVGILAITLFGKETEPEGPNVFLVKANNGHASAVGQEQSAVVGTTKYKRGADRSWQSQPVTIGDAFDATKFLNDLKDATGQSLEPCSQNLVCQIVEANAPTEAPGDVRRYKVWIGALDGRLYKYEVLTQSGAGLGLMAARMVVEFSDYNTPIVLTAPSGQDSLLTPIQGRPMPKFTFAPTTPTAAGAVPPLFGATPQPAPGRPAVTAAAQPGASRENGVPLYTPAETADGWRITVVATTPNGDDGVRSASRFNRPPKPENQFYFARISATRTGQQPAKFDASFRARAVGATSVAYSTFENGCGSIPDEIPSAEVFPGGTVTGNVCWEVVSSDADSLVLYDSPLLGNGRVYFRLR